MTSRPSFGHEKNYQVEHYFPANFLGRVKKAWLSTALGLVSQLFRSCSFTPLNFKYRTSTVFLNAPHNENLKCGIFFKLVNEILTQQQKT